jgi:HIRAN domain
LCSAVLGAVVKDGKGFQLISGAGSKTYPVGIVGEASYQEAIRRCAAGQHVQIFHELENPYDEKALAVVTMDGETIGYIARDCWLQDAVHEEGHGCEASIKEVSSANADTLGVVLDVCVGGPAVATRQFNQPKPPASPESNRWFARLFGL